MKKQIVEYLRNSKTRAPQGLVIVQRVDNETNPYLVVGWSLCRKDEKFDRKMAFRIAQNRIDKDYVRVSNPFNLINDTKWYLNIPKTLFPVLYQAQERSIKYFKDLAKNDNVSICKC